MPRTPDYTPKPKKHSNMIGAMVTCANMPGGFFKRPHRGTNMTIVKRRAESFLNGTRFR